MGEKFNDHIANDHHHLHRRRSFCCQQVDSKAKQSQRCTRISIHKDFTALILIEGDALNQNGQWLFCRPFESIRSLLHCDFILEIVSIGINPIWQGAPSAALAHIFKQLNMIGDSRHGENMIFFPQVVIELDISQEAINTEAKAEDEEETDFVRSLDGRILKGDHDGHGYDFKEVDECIEEDATLNYPDCAVEAVVDLEVVGVKEEVHRFLHNKYYYGWIMVDIFLICNLYMGKEQKKQFRKGFPLSTTPQSNAFKQQVDKEDKVLLSDTQSKFSHLMQTNPDQNYISIFRKDYDPLKETHRLDELEDNQYRYNQKAKRDRHFYLREEGQKKTNLNAPLTSNQQYGWREPIDTIPTKHGMRQQYDESLEVTLKNNKKK